MKKIYCFINGGYENFLNVVALAEDGHVLAEHVSSNEYWAKHDIGVTSDWKHDSYKSFYPNGYEVVWLDDPLADERCVAAIELNKKLNER
ncbi:hypothetical protein [Bacillus smithii]|uniref:hypothetical protein n=1 Tax=Bacillus smithii TaxID=1479 RepID=UPI003D24E07B